MEKDNLIIEILSIEWDMFSSVQNIGGTASCQKDRKTFEIMRKSQIMTWPEKMIKSYLDDIITARSNGINLMTEKYARMMASTSPEEYKAIKHLIEPKSPQIRRLIDGISEIILKWEKELFNKYPAISDRSRPLRSSEDTKYVTSVETYLKGELSTYSDRTLALYCEYVLNLKNDNINGSELIMENTVKHYGYNSLEEAERGQKSRLN